MNAFVADILTPIIAAVGGNPDFSALSFHVNGSVFLYGSFLNALITFVAVAAAVFFLVVKPVTRHDRPHGAGAGRARDARVPGVPERDPGRGTAVLALHGGECARSLTAHRL